MVSQIFCQWLLLDNMSVPGKSKATGEETPVAAKLCFNN
jgi:hypothetical protein